MASAVVIPAAGTHIYSAGTSIVRLLYVKSSTAKNLDAVLKRDSFIAKSLLIGQGISAFNFASMYFGTGDPKYGRSGLILYQACLDPQGAFTIPMYQVKPWDQILMYVLLMINIFSNFYLYRFLQKQTSQNIATTEIDKKKARKRNLVPASIGMIILAIFSFTLTFFMFTYMFKTELLDNGTRAFMNAMVSDLIHCLVSPFVIINSSIDAKKKIREILKLR